MKLVFLFLLTVILAGCAGQDTADCYEVEGNAVICEPHPHHREPREIREPRAGRE